MYSWFNLILNFQAAKLEPLFNKKRKEVNFLRNSIIKSLIAKIKVNDYPVIRYNIIPKIFFFG